MFSAYTLPSATGIALAIMDTHSSLCCIDGFPITASSNSSTLSLIALLGRKTSTSCHVDVHLA